MSLVRLFCDIDDFCQDFEPFWKPKSIEISGQKRQKPSKLCLSEIMTIIIAFHQSNYRTFKHYYLKQVSKHWQTEFPNLVSYSRFVELMPMSIIPLSSYLHNRKGKVTGISLLILAPL